MRGNWHTGCLASFAQVSSTLLSVNELRTNRYSSPENRSNTIENVSLGYVHAIQFPRHCNVPSPNNLHPTPENNKTSSSLLNSPVWRPFLLASNRAFTRLLECTTAGFFMIRPSFSKRAMLRRELAKEISLISLGSNQILRFPHLRTEAARRFWSLRDTVFISEGEGVEGLVDWCFTV